MALLPLWFQGLNPELEKYAEEELGETPGVRERALTDFRKLIKGRPDIYSRDDDLFLLRFLRSKKFDAERAFKTFCNYHRVMTKYKGVFTGKTPSEIRHVLEMNYVNYAPYRVPPCSLVWVFRINSFDLQKASTTDLIATQFILGELVTDIEATQVCGGIHVIDVRGISLQHYAQFAKLSFLSLILSILQDCWPQRFHSVHIIHNSLMWQGFNLAVRPLLKKKFRERIHLYNNDIDGLHQNVPRDFLPEELGGTMGPFDNTELASYVFSKEAYFKEFREYGIVKKDDP